MILTILLFLSLAVVLVILIAGIVVMARGGETNAKWSNVLMRYRVLAQAVAVAILMIVLYASSQH
jgi:Hypoxia induced protein conserved region